MNKDLEVIIEVRTSKDIIIFTDNKFTRTTRQFIISFKEDAECYFIRVSINKRVAELHRRTSPNSWDVFKYNWR